MRFFQTDNIQDLESNLVLQKNLAQKKKIIKHLFLHGSMTNTDLGQLVKLSAPKIISLLSELKNDGIIEELGQGNSSGGRRPNLYGIKEDALYIVGISINLHKTTISIFNGRNQSVFGEEELPVVISSGVAIIDPIVATTNALIKKYGIDRANILGVGIEMPGLIDSKNGINKTYFPIDKPLAAIFSEKFELPVLIENDAKARAFAELRFGGARNMKNVLVLHLDWGLGLGIIVNGKLYKGKNGFSGEFGHLPMVENGVLCKCGKQGCLETIASGTAIARMAREGIKAGRSSMLSTLVQEDLDKIETQTVVQAAVSGDQYTISILANVGFWLGKGLAYLIQIFNPELIILGGRMAEANQFLLTPVQQAIHTFCNPDLGNEIQIRFSELGSNAAIQGIAAMVLENELDKV